MKKVNMRVGVHGLIYNNQKQILVIKRSEIDPDEPNTWDTPGGGIENDSIEEGFKREVIEETGLVIEDIRLLGAYNIDDSNLQLLAKAKFVGGEVKLSFEHNAYKWITQEELFDLEYKGLHLKAACYLLKSENPIAKYGDY